jgi:hypothetical protein
VERGSESIAMTATPKTNIATITSIGKQRRWMRQSVRR